MIVRVCHVYDVSQQMKQKYFNRRPFSAPNSDLMEENSILDEWELVNSDVNLDIILGEGEFGVVRKAILTTTAGFQKVAVKMIKGEY